MASKEDRYWTDREVEEALNNATIGIQRWERLKDFKDKRGHTLREFTEGIVEILTEDTLKDTTTGELLLPPAEIALALQSAVVLVLYKYIIPLEQQRKTFIRQLTKS